MDVLMVPWMHLLAWSLETPQRTHFWNNRKLIWSQVKNLEKCKMVNCAGDPDAKQRWWWKIIPIFHMPILGGWKRYVALQPLERCRKTPWYIGWKCHDVIGVSQVPIQGPKGPVRTLRGPKNIFFFGVTEEGVQVPLKQIGEGIIGDGGPYKKVLLL